MLPIAAPKYCFSDNLFLGPETQGLIDLHARGAMVLMIFETATCMK